MVLLHAWLTDPAQPPTLNASFHATLASAAESRNVAVERGCDWLLALYGRLWPFVLVYAVATALGNGGGKPTEPAEEPAPELRVARAASTPAGGAPRTPEGGLPVGRSRSWAGAGRA